MDEYKDKALVGFDGSNFYEGYYQGKSFLALIDDEVCLLSNEEIASKSSKYREGYATDFAIEELEDLVKSKMYAIYKGNEYEVQRVSKRLKQLELIARKNNRKEDLELGFEDDVYERVTHKLVSNEEIESIRVEKKSVYKEFLEMYSKK